MKRTEYSKIAVKYDKNPIRHIQPRDQHIEDLLKSRPGVIHVLDLACGTGNYLQAQQHYFKQKRIRWYGCDLSKDMLEIAQKKINNTKLTNVNVEELPYQSDSFDLVRCNFAFHHFENKSKVIKEVHRILKSNGLFVMKNISVEMMPLWWIYTFFPSTRKIDRERFWSNKKLFSKIEMIGFNVEIKVTLAMKRQSSKEIYTEAKNRDSSQLTLIRETEYLNGLKKIRELRKDEYLGQFALLKLIGRKQLKNQFGNV